MKDSCHSCGYCKKEEDQYYCADKDCYVDPFDPECNYNE